MFFLAALNISHSVNPFVEGHFYFEIEYREIKYRETFISLREKLFLLTELPEHLFSTMEINIKPWNSNLLDSTFAGSEGHYI